jgi:hypothetical protein
MTGSDRPNVGLEPGISDPNAPVNQSLAPGPTPKVDGSIPVAPALTQTPSLPPGTAPVVPSNPIVLSTPKVPNLGDVDKDGSVPVGSIPLEGKDSSPQQGEEDVSPEAPNTEEHSTSDGTCKSSDSENL